MGAETAARKTRVYSGFLKAKSKQPAGVVGWADDLLRGWHPDSVRLWKHVLVSGARRHRDDGAWVPVYCRLREAEVPDAEYWALVERGLLEMKEHDRRSGRSREYRVPFGLRYDYAVLLLKAGPGTDRADLFSGKPTRRLRRTADRDPDTGTKYPPRTVAAMRGVRKGLFNGPAVERHVARRERDAAIASARVEALTGMEMRQAAAALHAWEESVRDADRYERLPPPSPFAPNVRDAIRDAEGALGRFMVDSAARTALHEQVTKEHPGGVFEYQPAYEPQSSGRMTDVGGRLQNATREMKHAAWSDVPGYHVVNYDLKSSQPRMLIDEFEKAGVGTANIHALLLSGKEEHARAVGITEDAWKRALMAVVMGAVLFRSAEAGLTPWGEARSDALRYVMEGAFSDPHAAYERFQERVRPLYEDLQEWRRWLVHEWLPENETTGRGGKRFATNEAGAKLDLSGLKDREVPRKLAAHVLQGREASFIYEVTGLQDRFGYEVIGNEHDGVVVLGEIPPEAIEEARTRTGMESAQLVPKPLWEGDEGHRAVGPGPAR